MPGNPFGNIIGTLGNILGLPEFGISERFGSEAPQVQRQTADIFRAIGQGNKPNSTQAPKPKPQPKNANTQAVPKAPVASWSGGSRASSGGGTDAFDPAAQAYYADQIDQVRSAMGRIGNQRNIGNKNIDSAYSSALNRLLGQNATAERDYGVNRQNTIDDNVGARSRVDETVSRQSAGLRRLLGSNSSAALFAAPRAVAEQGNSQLGDIQTGYSRNLRSLETADEDRKRSFNEGRNDLKNQTQIQRNSLKGSLAETEATLLDQLSQLQIQKAQSAGQDYNDARSATQSNNNRVNNLLAQIDRLGLNPTIQAKNNIKFNAPDLARYNTSDINIAPGASPLQQSTGQFMNLLGYDDDRKKIL